VLEAVIDCPFYENPCACLWELCKMGVEDACTVHALICYIKTVS